MFVIYRPNLLWTPITFLTQLKSTWVSLDKARGRATLIALRISRPFSSYPRQIRNISAKVAHVDLSRHSGVDFQPLDEVAPNLSTGTAVELGILEGQLNSRSEALVNCADTVAGKYHDAWGIDVSTL